MQLSHKSPVQFNAYLASIERDLPQQTEQASAMTFYSKLSSELKRQFKTSNIQIPETRAKCVAISQRIWEGLQQDGLLSNIDCEVLGLACVSTLTRGCRRKTATVAVKGTIMKRALLFPLQVLSIIRVPLVVLMGEVPRPVRQ